MDAIRYLSLAEVVAINIAVIQKYSPGEPIGIKSKSLLESALLRPQSSAYEEASPSIFEKATALFQSLGENHAFQHANKRTAFTALVIFLHYNGYHFKMEPKQATDFTVNMVNHMYTFEEIVELISDHSVSF
ncbi:type II toxin-antitoxin system death-on-curing family toxin [Paenibacillus sp. KACC 21273]|uniref:type II toxin-antitoxin system death-on-curing family toxin n=1 Tax=Paenibacillus sp. KACC 21273 TaxID=3025665 RepID=UPI0023667869|nr:type II toxin-antitoxin system death-on-curing family toxin [Paenibacillus sp. KACC 21273]WDF50735.1 type II toxin-antitoxin system death-on-curing family toxin [Paenibacillus sp. KACC 21273]